MNQTKNKQITIKITKMIQKSDYFLKLREKNEMQFIKFLFHYFTFKKLTNHAN